MKCEELQQLLNRTQWTCLRLASQNTNPKVRLLFRQIAQRFATLAFDLSRLNTLLSKPDHAVVSQ